MAAMVNDASQADQAAVAAIRAEVVAEARRCLGIGYVEGGTTPEQGFDCEGLVVWCFARRASPFSGARPPSTARPAR